MPTTPTPIPVPKTRKHRRVKVYGYALEILDIYNAQAAIGKIVVRPIPESLAALGMTATDNIGSTYHDYVTRLLASCGATRKDIVYIADPKDSRMPPLQCLVFASNRSKEAKIPNQDIIKKAREFLGIAEDPKWYYQVTDVY